MAQSVREKDKTDCLPRLSITAKLKTHNSKQYNAILKPISTL